MFGIAGGKTIYRIILLLVFQDLANFKNNLIFVVLSLMSMLDVLVLKIMLQNALVNVSNRSLELEL